MGNTAIRIVVAGAPRGKQRPRFVRATGHAFTPQETRSYEAVLQLAAQQAMRGRPLLEGPVSVQISAGFPIPASWSIKRKDKAVRGLERPTVKPDADNIVKIAGDALNQIVWRDDRQIVECGIGKHYSVSPSLIIEVTPLNALTEIPGTVSSRAA